MLIWTFLPWTSITILQRIWERVNNKFEHQQEHINSKGFWRQHITISIIGSPNYVHRLILWKEQCGTAGNGFVTEITGPHSPTFGVPRDTELNCCDAVRKTLRNAALSVCLERYRPVSGTVLSNVRQQHRAAHMSLRPGFETLLCFHSLQRRHCFACLLCQYHKNKYSTWHGVVKYVTWACAKQLL